MTSHRLELVVSGGQTGADRAGLEAARIAGIPTGGWAPHGFLTTRGPDPSLAAFGLREIELGTPTAMYIARTKRNVTDSDGTVVFQLHASPGTTKTVEFCRTGKWSGPATGPAYRPCLTISNLDNPRTPNHIAEWIVAARIRRLNVAGHREGPDVGAEFATRVRDILVKTFEILATTA